MEIDRRRALQKVGVSLSGIIVAGCVSSPGRGSGADSAGPDEAEGSDPIETAESRSPRIDEPPSDITEPECDDGTDRDPLWLFEGMSPEPSLEFEQVETTSAVFADEGLRFQDREEEQYYATFLTEDDTLDRLSDESSGNAVELITDTDFETQAVLVVQTGGWGSKTPHLQRIEERSMGTHAFGCYRQPCVWTEDYTVRTVVARFERPASFEGSMVSLTVDAETRVTFGVYDW